MATFEPVGKLSFHRVSHNMLIAKKEINVDSQTAGTAGQIAQNSVLKAIPVKAGDTVLKAWIEVYTSCTGGASVDVGVGEDVDMWLDGGPLDGQVVDTNTTAVKGGPHYFHTADTIDAKVLEAAVTAGRFAVCALIVRM